MSAAEWIAQRRELLDAATEGPWEAEYSSLHRDCVVPHDARSTREAVAQTRLLRAAGDAALIADARTSLPCALDALEAVLAFATAERDKISRTYVLQPDMAYAGYANAMDDVIRIIESALRGES